MPFIKYKGNEQAGDKTMREYCPTRAEEQKLGVVKRIVDYRMKNRLNQKQLVEKVGVTQKHISKIESGDFANVQILEKVFSAIGYAIQIRVVPTYRREAI